jgi:hypothetical protein
MWRAAGTLPSRNSSASTCPATAHCTNDRVHRLLETASIKLGLVVTYLLEASARAMLRALRA